MRSWLIRDVEVEGRRVDVHVADGVVTAIGALDRRREADDLDEVGEVDGAGGALLPGLHDHHVHLLAMAARLTGVDLDPLSDPASVDAALRSAAAEAEPVRSTRVGARDQRTVSAEGGGRWIRAAGYDEHRHGPMDRRRLDALAPGTAVRVQHRSGLGWVLSSTALAALGLDGGAPEPVPDGVELAADGTPTGWLFRLDGWLGERVPRTDVREGLARVGRSLVAVGITGVTDATHELGADRAALLEGAIRSGDLPTRLHVLGLDDPGAVAGWATLGPAKLLADEGLGLDPGALAVQIAAHHATGRPVAIHAVSRAENVAAVVALAEAGPMPGDRIEHGSVLPPELDPVLAAGGVTVVVQPALVAERGDHHLAEVDPDDLPYLHRHASLLAAGVRVGVGSDAPVTTVDPWAGMAAATGRRSRSGAPVGPDEAVPAAVALGWYLADPSDPGGRPRRLTVGAPADLCLLDAPLAEALARPTSERVRSTWVDGRLGHP